MTRCESYPPCFGTIYFPTAPSYTLYTISLNSSMMYIRQVQILVQAQICTWLIVYTKSPGCYLPLCKYHPRDTFFHLTCVPFR